MDVPKNLQDKLAQYQNLQGQLQLIAIQKQQLMVHDADIGDAQKEIESFTQGRIYRMAGSLIIESSKEECDKKLSEDHETTDARIKVLEKQEKKLVTKLNEMRVELQSMIGETKAG
jgi:prefoldin beta subunit